MRRFNLAILTTLMLAAPACDDVDMGRNVLTYHLLGSSNTAQNRHYMFDVVDIFYTSGIRSLGPTWSGQVNIATFPDHRCGLGRRTIVGANRCVSWATNPLTCQGTVYSNTGGNERSDTVIVLDTHVGVAHGIGRVLGLGRYGSRTNILHRYDVMNEHPYSDAYFAGSVGGRRDAVEQALRWIDGGCDPDAFRSLDLADPVNLDELRDDAAATDDPIGYMDAALEAQGWEIHGSF